MTLDGSAAEQGAVCPNSDITDILESFQSSFLGNSGPGAALLLGTRWHMDLLVLQGGFVALLQPLLQSLAEGNAALAVGVLGSRALAVGFLGKQGLGCRFWGSRVLGVVFWGIRSWLWGFWGSRALGVGFGGAGS